MEPWQRIGTYRRRPRARFRRTEGQCRHSVAHGHDRRRRRRRARSRRRQRHPERRAQGNVGPGFLNERLMNDLRPTLFLAQLSNLLAGNIAIVHGVTGSSRTFMGEEAAGVDAVRIALARIAAGQSDIALVGGAHNGERRDMLMLYEFGDFNLKDHFAPVWARAGNPAVCARLGRRVPGDRIQGARPGARRQALRAADRRGRRPCPTQRPARSRRRSRRQWAKLGIRARTSGASSPAPPAPSRRPRKSAPSSLSIRHSGPRHRHDVRPQHGDAVSAEPRACRPVGIAAASCFRPTIRPGWRLQ